MNLQTNIINNKESNIKKKPGSNLIFNDTISILQKRHYGFLSKIFCCKCFYCCQNVDFSLLTSKHRKGAFQRMVKKYLKSMHQTSQSKTNVIIDPFFILVALLLGQQSQIYGQLLEQVGNSNQKTIFSKEDLEFYILELCTYLVFHQQMNNLELSSLLQRACTIDLHFSLRYYFFMKSLEILDSTYEIKKLSIVQNHNNLFRTKINIHHKIRLPKNKQKNVLKNQSKVQVNLTQQIKESDMQITKQFFRLSKNQQNQNKRLQDIKIQKRDSIRTSQSSDIDTQAQDDINMQFCRKYNSNMSIYPYFDDKLNNLNLTRVYESFILKTKSTHQTGLFDSTVNFFNDLVELSQLLIKKDIDRNQIFTSYLKQINQRLPAVVYIPFSKDEYQQLNILKIIIEQSRVFKTKQRAPFKICFQTFRNSNITSQSIRQKKIKSTNKNIKRNSNVKRSTLFQQDIILQIEDQENKQVNQNNFVEKSQNYLYDSKLSKSRLSQKYQKNDYDATLNDSTGSGMSNSDKNSRMDLKNIKKNIWHKIFQLKKKAKQFITEKQKLGKSQKSISDSKSQNNKTNNDSIHQNQKSQNISDFSQNVSVKASKQQKNILKSRISQKKSQTYNQTYQNHQQKYFGQAYSQICYQISNRSLYSKLPGFKIVNIMVKSNDDLRQECFAMQLLQQFQRIFKMQKLNIKLYPYQVLPLSYNSGIIQYIPEAITIDDLIKKDGNLLSICKSKNKMKNFLASLVGYSLVTYFLQVKDRHNANIMLKKDGSIIHIDYGFFLSSMPGKGVELQKNVPFKFTNQYIDVLGGTKSKLFQQFRKLFYQGFNSLRMHQHRILILTKLMYSSYGTTMRCFEKGDQSIQKFVERFNPKNVRTDGELFLYCQQLINGSIQNWRAKWYDRYQYFAQGIKY